MKRFYTIILTATLLCGSALYNAAIAKTITVNTLQQLKDNIEEYDVIIVSDQLVLTDGTELNGMKTDANGKKYNTIIQVPTPYINEDGTPNTNPSNFGALRLATGAKVTLSYLTIMGGGIYPMFDSSKEGTTLNIEYYIAAVQNGRRYLSSDGTKEYPEDGGTLYMDHCTVQRSERGMYNYHGQTIMTHCKLIRNTARFGAGALNEDGVLIMDGCSFSENRSTRDGGAMESKVNARTYLNNTIMANNIGGMSSINNNRGAQCYFMNSTVTGNMSYNNDYSIVNIVSDAKYDNPCCYACNSIITNNYRFDAVNGGTTITEKDINNSTGTVNLYNCIYGTNNNTTNINCYQSTSSSDIFQDNINSSLFYAKYKKADGTIQYAKGGYYFFYAVGHTPAFDHTGLVHNDNGTIAAPVKSDGLAATTVGCKTYFNPVIDESDYNNTDVYMGYLDGTTIKDLKTGEAVTDATKYEGHEVTTLANGETRESTIVGSSPATNDTYYTLTLTGDEVHGTCLVDGATFFGDSYKEGKVLDVNVIGISSNYEFQYWKVTKDGVAQDNVMTQEFNLEMTAHTTIEPVYELAEGKTEGYYNISCTNTDGYEKSSLPTQYEHCDNCTTTVTIPDCYNKEVNGITYTFTGWIGANSSLPEKGVKLKRSSVGDKEYIACWQPETIEPTMNPNYVDDGYLYGTFYDKDNKYALPNGVQAYTAKLNDEKTTLTMHLMATGDGTEDVVIPANVAVVLKADKSVYDFSEQTAPYSITLYSSTNDPVEDTPNSLSGVNEETATSTLRQNTGDVLYVLSNRTTSGEKITGIGFYKLAESVENMPAHKAFVKVSATTNDNAQASAPIRRIPFDFSATEQTEEQTGTSVATDIDQISNEQLQMSNKLLIDGHLYIIRDARVYNAQGQLVK